MINTDSTESRDLCMIFMWARREIPVINGFKFLTLKILTLNGFSNFSQNPFKWDFMDKYNLF